MNDSRLGSQENEILGTTVATDVDDGKTLLLILAVSLGGAGLVLVISVFGLCCYFYRLRRRNYPINSLALENCGDHYQLHGGSSSTRRGDDKKISCCDRSRSPVTTEADIYGYDDNDRRKPNLRPETGSFGKPNQKTTDQSEFSTPPLDQANFGNGTRKSSSDSAAAPPGFPSMVVVDETSDDHRRLVPNDCLSLEVERSQRFYRHCHEYQRQAFESEQNLEQIPDESPTSSNVKPVAIRSEADNAKTHPVPPYKKRLRRKLAETIANDRVLETTVTFTNENSDTPIASSSPRSFNSNSLPAIGRRFLNIKKKDSEDDDLEVIFKERTPL